MNVPLQRLVGFSHPLRRGPTAYFALDHDRDVIRTSVRTIIGTEQGERVMRPTFGVQLERLLWEPDDNVLADSIIYEVETALALWEPRVLVLEVAPSVLRIAHVAQYEVRYRIRTTGFVDSVDGELPLDPRAGR